MKMRVYLFTSLIAVLLGIVFFFIDPKISCGILLSAAYSMVNMLLLGMTMKITTSQGNVNFGALMTGNIIRFTLMGLVIFLAIRNPQIFNVIGVAIGFTLFMVALLIDAATRKGGEN